MMATTPKYRTTKNDEPQRAKFDESSRAEVTPTEFDPRTITPSPCARCVPVPSHLHRTADT